MHVLYYTAINSIKWCVKLLTLLGRHDQRQAHQLRQLHTIRRSLTSEATRALVQAFVSCCLEYCNFLLAGVADVRYLQSVQNAAAHLVSGTRRYEHDTSLASNSSADYFLSRRLFLYRSVYTTKRRVICQTCMCWLHLQTSSVTLCSVPVSGVLLSFDVYGPRTWNHLPAALLSPDLTTFKRQLKRQLKAHLFQR